MGGRWFEVSTTFTYRGHPWRQRHCTNTVDFASATERTWKDSSRRFLLFVLAFVLAVIFLGPTDGGLEDTPPWRFVLAILPLLPGNFASSAYLKFLKEADEFAQERALRGSVQEFHPRHPIGFRLQPGIAGIRESEDAGAILLGDCKRRLSSKLPACLETL